MTSPAPLIGTQLGPYRIEALLGSGGMATVYRGVDTNLQRPVAIKLLSAALAGDPDYVRRFKREAQLIASLQHPNVAQVYALGEQDGTPYMVQELLPGPTLEQRLADLAAAGAHLARTEVFAILRQLAAALDAAHRLGVIHRDVKPSNAIANAQGELVLTDFGIARSSADTNLTQAGVVMGTPAYVAPEQAISSAALTPAADVYALGVLLFQMLTGKLPFVADTPTAVVLKHLYEAPPAPTQLRPHLPATLDAVVLRALEKEPDQRYQSAGELAAAVEQAWPAAPRPAAPPPAVAPAPVHSLPTTAWAQPGAPAAPQVHQVDTRLWQVGTQTRAQTPPAPAPAPAAPAPVASQPAAPRRGGLLPWLGLALAAALALGALAAWRGGTDAMASAPTAAAESAAPAAVPTEAPTEAPAAAPTEAPAAAPTEAPAAAPTEAPAAAADPLDELGQLIAIGLSDGSAGDDGPEYFQRYGYLVEAIGSDDRKRAREEIRELTRKIAERDREGKLDPSFAASAAVLLQAVSEQYGLDNSSERQDD